jgi:putative addiction module antidote
MLALKLRKIGNSLGVTLPREAVARLRVAEGDTLFLTETPDGFALTPFDEAFAAALAAFEDGRKDLRNALRALARERAKPGRIRR